VDLPPLEKNSFRKVVSWWRSEVDSERLVVGAYSSTHIHSCTCQLFIRKNDHFHTSSMMMSTTVVKNKITKNIFIKNASLFMKIVRKALASRLGLFSPGGLVTITISLAVKIALPRKKIAGQWEIKSFIYFSIKAGTISDSIIKGKAIIKTSLGYFGTK